MLWTFRFVTPSYWGLLKQPYKQELSKDRGRMLAGSKVVPETWKERVTPEANTARAVNVWAENPKM